MAPSTCPSDEIRHIDILSENQDHGDGEGPAIDSAARDQETRGCVKGVYAENPLCYSIKFILTLAFIDKFCFYGTTFTEPGFLTGYYNPDWNPGFSPNKASGYISLAHGIVGIVPWIAAFFADILIGDYWTIVVFGGLFYIPGLILIGLLSVESLLGPTFNMGALRVAIDILWPLGVGTFKTLLGVYGAKQFNPVTQQEKIEGYFVTYTGVEFLGSFSGGIITALIAETNFPLSQFLLAFLLFIGLVLFLFGTKRYVNTTIMRQKYIFMAESFFLGLLCYKSETTNNGKKIRASPPGFGKTKRSNGGDIDDSIVDSLIQVLWLIPLMLLILPYNVGFSQIIVLAIMQGRYLNPGRIPEALNISFSLFFVGIWAILINRFLYPFLAKRNIKIATSHKFALGSFFLMLTFAIMALINYFIKTTYQATGHSIAGGWQYLGFAIAGGTAFAFSAMNELAFVVAPYDLKILGNAITLFLGVGIANLIGATIFRTCEHWFLTSEGNKITGIESYVLTQSEKYIYLMIFLSGITMILTVLPPVKKFIARIEESSIARAKKIGAGETLEADEAERAALENMEVAE